MNRVIKFRAWDTQEKRMRDPNDPMQDVADGRARGLQGMIQFAESNGYVLMQFTGLLDKNGKEIYEGDILEAKSTNFTFRDTIKRGWSWGNATDNIYGYFWETSGEALLRGDDPAERFQIIGNIYENPGLV